MMIIVNHWCWVMKWSCHSISSCDGNEDVFNTFSSPITRFKSKWVNWDDHLKKERHTPGTFQSTQFWAVNPRYASSQHDDGLHFFRDPVFHLHFSTEHLGFIVMKFRHQFQGSRSTNSLWLGGEAFPQWWWWLFFPWSLTSLGRGKLRSQQTVDVG